MEFKGTKGVWEVDVKYGYADIVCGDRIICDFAFTEYENEETANAKLIAAAPELLESLQEAIELLIESTEFDILTRYRDKVSYFELLIDRVTE